MVHVALSVFEVDGRQHPVSGMFTFRIIEYFDVVEYVLSGLFPRFVCSAVYAFTFEQVEEAFRDGIVMTITPPAHRMLDVVGSQKRRPIPAGVLRPLVGVD